MYFSYVKVREADKYWEVDLLPNNSQKSFYGKAKVRFNPNYHVLFSYDTPICVVVTETKQLYSIWTGGYTFNKNYGLWGTIPESGDWSRTTGKHIKAFCGLNKAEYLRCDDYRVLSDKQIAEIEELINS